MATPTAQREVPPAPAAWDGGWYRRARMQASPHFGPRPDHALIDLIVIHSISLPPGVYGGQAVHDLFMNRLDWDAHPYFQSIRGLQVSAHFFITRRGTLWQFVDCDQRAWHAGRSAYRGRSECNDDSVGIELEGLEGQRFTPSQYRALAGLCADLGQRYPIAHVAGHEHIAPGRKADPGAGFDWPRLQGLLGWPAERFPQRTGVR
ncbi:MAG: N-acetylmuramoyl-L-alanine amidase [Burkholderiales bacterium 68-12]|nr:MAG: N-acetylmuramoyl-L-alanine amidase [Burkholderiales bacterium 68-12]